MCFTCCAVVGFVGLRFWGVRFLSLFEHWVGMGSGWKGGIAQKPGLVIGHRLRKAIG